MVSQPHVPSKREESILIQLCQLLWSGRRRYRSCFDQMFHGSKGVGGDIQVVWHFSTPIWEYICDMVEFCSTWGRCLKKRRNLISICYVTAWLIWRARCNFVFNKTRISPNQLAGNIQSMVFSWIKHRRVNCSYNWIDWCSSPSYCM